MKSIHTFCFFFFAFAIGCSQPSHLIKASAFKRTVISGTPPGVTLHEDGTVTNNQRSPGEQYMIFLETTDSTKPDVAYLMINQKKYQAEIDRVSELPLVVKNGTGKVDDTLIAASNRPVWNITPGEAITGDKLDIRENSAEVILFIKEKKALHSFPIKDVKQLSPKRLD